MILGGFNSTSQETLKWYMLRSRKEFTSMNVRAYSLVLFSKLYAAPVVMLVKATRAAAMDKTTCSINSINKMSDMSQLD